MVTIKDDILILLKSTDDFISGEEISKKLGVTRAAIWKYIKQLKDEGYTIESYSKKGYRLTNSPDILTSGEVLSVLQSKYIGRDMLHYDSVDSTNNIARSNAVNGCREGLVVVAEEQTQGRGRLGRKWATPKSAAIAFSLVLRPFIKPEDAPKITLVTGTAVCRALRNATGLNAGIKWPNDIIVNNRKVCGILTEMNADMDAVNYIIVGVGLNVNIKEFPEEIREIATSIYIETGKPALRKGIFADVLKEIENLYDDFKVNGIGKIIEEFKNYSVTLGKNVKVISINESFEGKAADITDDGILIVELEGGEERRVLSGDVSVRGINGYV